MRVLWNWLVGWEYICLLSVRGWHHLPFFIHCAPSICCRLPVGQLGWQEREGDSCRSCDLVWECIRDLTGFLTALSASLTAASWVHPHFPPGLSCGSGTHDMNTLSMCSNYTIFILRRLKKTAKEVLTMWSCIQSYWPIYLPLWVFTNMLCLFKWAGMDS